MTSHPCRRSLGIAAVCWAAVVLVPTVPVAASEPYLIVDALLLDRDNRTGSRPLVIDGNTGQTVIGTGNLDFPVAGGVRAFVGRHGCDACGWELGYLGVYGMSASTMATGSANLDIAPPLNSQVASLAGASLADASYDSTLNGFEANLLATEIYAHQPRHTGYEIERVPYVATIDWLAGFRWAGLDERAAIALTTPGLGTSQYAVRSSSNLFGGQIGARGRIDWDRWAFEGQAKAAVAGSVLSQSQAPVVDAISGEVYRSARGGNAGDVGGIFEWNTSIVKRLGEVWSVRAGYTMIWLTGVALAPNQFDFSLDTLAGTTVAGGQTVWLQGATVGLEARW